MKYGAQPLSPPSPGVQRRHPQDSSSGEFGTKEELEALRLPDLRIGNTERPLPQAKHRTLGLGRCTSGLGRMGKRCIVERRTPVQPPAPSTPEFQGPARNDRTRRIWFIGEREGVSALNTLRENRFVSNGLKPHSELKGYVLVEQWTPMDVRELRTAWHVAPNTASKYMEIIKSFFDFSVANGWIAVNPAKLVKTVKSKFTENEKERIPFTDEEIRRMFDACENQYGKRPIRWARDVHHRAASGEIANYRYKWTGQDLADFISVSMSRAWE